MHSQWTQSGLGGGRLGPWGQLCSRATRIPKRAPQKERLPTGQSPWGGGGDVPAISPLLSTPGATPACPDAAAVKGEILLLTGTCPHLPVGGNIGAAPGSSSVCRQMTVESSSDWGLEMARISPTAPRVGEQEEVWGRVDPTALAQISASFPGCRETGATWEERFVKPGSGAESFCLR